MIKLVGSIRLASAKCREIHSWSSREGGAVRDAESLVSPVVEAWATYRTSSAADWPTRRLLRA